MCLFFSKQRTAFFYKTLISHYHNIQMFLYNLCTFVYSHMIYLIQQYFIVYISSVLVEVKR